MIRFAFILAALLPLHVLAQVNGLARITVAPAGPCTGTDAGVYTPAAAAVQNVAFLSAVPATWMRINQVVSVSGAVLFTPSASVFDPLPPQCVGDPSLACETPTHAEFYLSPPVPTVFTNFYQLSGVMSARAGAGSYVYGVPISNMARFYFDAREAAGSIRYTYTYQITECSQ